MDFPAFREQFEAISALPERTAFLLVFAEEAMQSCPDDLEPLLADCARDCASAGHPVEAALCTRVLGWLDFDRAEYPRALGRFEEALRIFEDQGEEQGKLKALNGIASVHMEQGRMDAALAVYRAALAQAEKLGDRNQAFLLRSNIGEALLGLGQYAEAEQYVRPSPDAPGQSLLNQVLGLNQLAQALVPQGKVDEARQILGLSVTIARREAFLPALAEALGHLGALEAGRSPGPEGEALLEEALDVARRAGHRGAETRVLLARGRLLLARGQGDGARALFGQALEAGRAMGSWPLESEAWRGLSESLKSLGRWEEALEAFERFHETSARSRDENATRQVAWIKADQARREAELYREQSRILAHLGDLGQRITASLDLETIVMTIYEAIGGLMKADFFGLGLYHQERNVIDYRLFIEAGVRIPPFEASAHDQTFSGWCLRNRQIVFMNDIEKEYRRYIPDLPRRFGHDPKHSQSCLFLPLLAEGQVLGILSAQSYETNAYTERDLATLKTLAASISIAVQNARLFEKVHQLATVDSLTGASTRRHLFDRTEEEFQRFRRDSTPLALVMIDLDHFKALNDTWGHAFGDRVLTDFGALCLAHKRPHDLFGRYGGEEFALVLSGTTLEGALRSAQRLCQQVRDMPVTAPDGSLLKLTASFGVTAFGPGDGEITRVFGRADEALYEAKEGGRDRVVSRTP